MGTGPVGEIRTHSRRLLRPLRLPVAARPEILVGEEGFEPSLFAQGLPVLRTGATPPSLPLSRAPRGNRTPRKEFLRLPCLPVAPSAPIKKATFLGVAFSSNFFSNYLTRHPRFAG